MNPSPKYLQSYSSCSIHSLLLRDVLTLWEWLANRCGPALLLVDGLPLVLARIPVWESSHPTPVPLLSTFVFLNDLLSQGNSWGFCFLPRLFLSPSISPSPLKLIKCFRENRKSMAHMVWENFFLDLFYPVFICFHISLSCLRFLSVFGKINLLEKQNCGRYWRGSSLKND